jgi:hypothetical protein
MNFSPSCFSRLVRISRTLVVKSQRKICLLAVRSGLSRDLATARPVFAEDVTANGLRPESQMVALRALMLMFRKLPDLAGSRPQSSLFLHQHPASALERKSSRWYRDMSFEIRHTTSHKPQKSTSTLHPTPPRA